MKFSTKDFFSKCDQIHWKQQIWLHLLKKSLMENFIFCAVLFLQYAQSKMFGSALNHAFVLQSRFPLTF